VVAADRTAARGLDGRHAVLPVDRLEVLGGTAHAGPVDRRGTTLVPRAKAPRLRVGQDLGPDLVALADGHRVHVPGALIRNGPDVRSTHDCRNAFLMALSGDLVGTG